MMEQIAKVFVERRDHYDNTERISLVSSFVVSLLAGTYAPIDFADGYVGSAGGDDDDNDDDDGGGVVGVVVVVVVRSFLFCLFFFVSFLSCVLLARSGMNLLDISTKRWHQPALDACAPQLGDRLGQPASATTVIV